MNLATILSIQSGCVGSGRHKEGFHIKVPAKLYQQYKGKFDPKKYNFYSGSSLAKDFDKSKELFAVKVKDIDIASDKDVKNWDAEDQRGVKLYREAIQKGNTLDPIEVYHDKSGKILIEDGDHRAAAARQEGVGHILAWVAHGGRKTNIKAGGPGSGRHPWGRKEKEHVNLKELSHKERVEYLKKYITEHTVVGDKPKNTTKPILTPAEKIYPHSGKGSMGVGKHPDVKQEERLGKIIGPAGKPAVGLERKNAPAPFYRKSMDEAEVAKEKAGQAEMRNWQQQHPVGTQRETAIQKGDEVKTLKTTKAFDNDKLEFKQFKPGTTLTVINVLPKVGNNPQLMVAQYPGRQGDMVHMPVTDVRLHRTLEGIQEKPAYKIREEIGLTKGIRPGKIAQQIETPTGATYTKLKPESAGRPQGSGNIKKSGNSDEHSLKGKFSTARGPKGNELKEIFTFDTRLKSFGQGTARATVWDASKTPRTPDQAKHGTEGTTVIAWRDTKNKSGKVIEFDKDANGYIKQGSKPMQSFSNLGKMSGYLKQRYGVSMKLPGDSVAKKGRKK